MRAWTEILEGKKFAPNVTKNFLGEFATWASKAKWKPETATSGDDFIAVKKGAESIAISLLTGTVSTLNNGNPVDNDKMQEAVKMLFSKKKIGPLEFENGYARMDASMKKRLVKYLDSLDYNE